MGNAHLEDGEDDRLTLRLIFRGSVVWETGIINTGFY